MNNLNSILIEGNLTKDPEYKLTPKGTPLCKFIIATNRFYKKNESEDWENEVSYFEIVTWAKLAEICNKHLKKGRGVRIIGRLKQNRWKDDEGNGYSKVCIIADNIEFKLVFNQDIFEMKKEE